MSASNNNNKTNDDENASLLKKKQDSDGLVVVLTDKPSAAVSNKRNLLILIILLVLIPLSMVVLAMLLLSGAVVYYNIPNEHVPNPLFPLNGLFFGVVWFSNSSGVLFNSTVAVNNPNFDMKKNKTLIYVHGWQRGTTIERYYETFMNTLPNSRYEHAAKPWIEDGWNVGVFYWNQFSDEIEVQDAEDKIWNVQPDGLRWQSANDTDHMMPSNITAAHLFFNSVVEQLSFYANANTEIRIAGHSLGSQMATRVSYLLYQAAANQQINPYLVPKRVALLDPYFSSNTKDYLPTQSPTTGSMVFQMVQEMQNNVTIEVYKSSLYSRWSLMGDCNDQMTALTAFTDLYPDFLPILAFRYRHMAAKILYLLSYNTSKLPMVLRSDGTEVGRVGPSARTSTTETRSSMKQHFVQLGGIQSSDPRDYTYTLKNGDSN